MEVRSSEGLGVARRGMVTRMLHSTQVTAEATQPKRARLVGLAFVFLWFAIGGVAHFVFTDVEIRIVPPYIPWPRAAVLVSGVFELLGACGLLLDRVRGVAGIGLFVLTIFVTPVHVYMLQHPELFSVPYWALVMRLPLQLGLLILIEWATFWNARR